MEWTGYVQGRLGGGRRRDKGRKRRGGRGRGLKEEGGRSLKCRREEEGREGKGE